MRISLAKDSAVNGAVIERVTIRKAMNLDAQSRSKAPQCDNLRTLQVPQKRFVETPMALLHHDEGALDGYQLDHPAPRILEPRQPVHHRTELLWDVIPTSDKPGHRTHTKALAAGKNDGGAD